MYEVVKLISAIVIGLAVGAAFVVLSAVFLQFLFNVLLTELFGLPTITFSQAVGLALLLSLLSAMFSSRGSK